MISSQDGYGTRALSFGVFLFYSYAICLGYVKLERDRTQLINNTKKKKTSRMEKPFEADISCTRSGT
ncbi:MAG TPA: hypothetical protein VK014_02075 [Cyclobacteriaceae bacterium]|nr:hypothetical protein [Cyclobacteriaceae bacterium]